MGWLIGSGMVETLRPRLMLQRRQWLGAAPLALLFLLPLVLSLALLVPGLVDAPSFVTLFKHPQFYGALKLTVFTGVLSAALSVLLAISIVAQARGSILQSASVFLSVPHLALAMGFGFLIAPTGLVARLIAVLFTGWTEPPQWQTTQDPHGLALIAALVLKETPFLVWALASLLQQDELRQRFARETAVARSLGHGPRSAFFRIVLPQLMSRSVWPIIAVFSYGMTVVDMALVIGPTQPPTLAQLVWTDLNDGDAIANARGSSGTLVLSGVIALVIAGVWLTLRLLRPMLRRWMTGGDRSKLRSLGLLELLWPVWKTLYGLVIVALVVQSLSTLWPFPQLLANEFSGAAWARLLGDVTPVWMSMVLAIVSCGLALGAVVIWLETQSTQSDRIALFAATIMLCVPALLVALGQYRLLLKIGGTGTWFGLIFAHVLPVTAYMFVMLQGPYRAFDPRWQAAGNGLGIGRMRFLTRAKWPMLKAPLLSALSIGFAVSMAQFVGAQLAAAGRFSTLPMEAVTLSSGGNRALIAAYALVLMAVPLIAFQLAAVFSRPRWGAA
jgi:putative thiamine transport system permease protein